MRRHVTAAAAAGAGRRGARTADAHGRWRKPRRAAAARAASRREGAMAAATRGASADVATTTAAQARRGGGLARENAWARRGRPAAAALHAAEAVLLRRAAVFVGAQLQLPALLHDVHVAAGVCGRAC